MFVEKMGRGVASRLQNYCTSGVMLFFQQKRAFITNICNAVHRLIVLTNREYSIRRDSYLNTNERYRRIRPRWGYED